MPQQKAPPLIAANSRVKTGAEFCAGGSGQRGKGGACAFIRHGLAHGSGTTGEQRRLSYGNLATARRWAASSDSSSFAPRLQPESQYNYLSLLIGLKISPIKE